MILENLLEYGKNNLFIEELKLSIKYANQIVKEIEERGPIQIPNNCIIGEEFEK